VISVRTGEGEGGGHTRRKKRRRRTEKKASDGGGGEKTWRILGTKTFLC